MDPACQRRKKKRGMRYCRHAFMQDQVARRSEKGPLAVFSEHIVKQRRVVKLTDCIEWLLDCARSRGRTNAEKERIQVQILVYRCGRLRRRVASRTTAVWIRKITTAGHQADWSVAVLIPNVPRHYAILWSTWFTKVRRKAWQRFTR